MSDLDIDEGALIEAGKAVGLHPDRVEPAIRAYLAALPPSPTPSEWRTKAEALLEVYEDPGITLVYPDMARMMMGLLREALAEASHPLEPDARVAEEEVEVAMLREALEYIAEEHDAGRHDGLPEPCPAHDDCSMWLRARAALSPTQEAGE
jgi:hypothetical protein